jgi:hypothetical protein
MAATMRRKTFPDGWDSDASEHLFAQAMDEVVRQRASSVRPFIHNERVFVRLAKEVTVERSVQS